VLGELLEIWRVARVVRLSCTVFERGETRHSAESVIYEGVRARKPLILTSTRAFVRSGLLLLGGPVVLFALVYLFLRHVVRVRAGGSNEQMNTEVELA
jgi:hypothetical protein